MLSQKRIKHITCYKHLSIKNINLYNINNINQSKANVCKNKQNKDLTLIQSDNNNNNNKTDKELEDKIYAEYLFKKEHNYLMIKHKSMCQKSLIIDCKRCEVCLKINDNKNMILCDLCEDAYHVKCIDKYKDNDDRFYCKKCIRENFENIYNSKDIFGCSRKTGKHGSKNCCYCLLSINVEENYDNNYSLKKCLKCYKNFHKKCFVSQKDSNNYNIKLKKSNLNNVLCTECLNKIYNVLKNCNIKNYFNSYNKTAYSNNTIYSYNCIENKYTSNNNSKNKNLLVNCLILNNDEDNNINQSYFNSNNSLSDIKDEIIVKLNQTDFTYNNYSKKIYKLEDYNCMLEKYHDNLRLKVFNYALISDKENKRLKESLMEAMIFKNYKFCDNLVYENLNIYNKNNANKEPGLFPCTNHNRLVYYEFKKHTVIGNYPGLEVVTDDRQGFIVKAVLDIPAYTLICEYTGEVVPQRKVFFDNDNDSIMELLKAPSSVDSIVIKPTKYCNIARFISGINNYKSDSYKKINICCIKLNIDCQAHVILYSCRYIKSGEILYYDYNRGGYDYPTENFI